MIRRIVKLTFKEENTGEFMTIFENGKSVIRNFEGCHHLELLRDVNNPNVFFTFSIWDSEADLNAYRNSDFFANTWRNTKALFAAGPEAWSLEQLVKEDAQT